MSTFLVALAIMAGIAVSMVGVAIVSMAVMEYSEYGDR